MGILSKRAAKYYFLHGLKLSAVSIGSILCVGFVWTFTMFGEDGWDEWIIGMVLQFTRYIVPYLNLCYSIYSPSWYDSLALSMGARRKDIFYGNIIKQSVFTLTNVLFFGLIALISGQTGIVEQEVSVTCISLLGGAFGLYMGHKVKKYGRVVMMAVCFIFIIFYTGTSVLSIIDGNFIAKVEAYKPVLIAGAVILFGVMEVMIYRVNKKSMVVL